LLGRVYLSQGDATGATESFEHAVISAEQAARNGSIPKELQQAYNATGDLLLDSGEPGNAMLYYQRTLKGLESMASAKRGLANDPRFIRSQALTTTRIGQAQEFLGDLAGAQATYASTLDTARRLVQMDPANVSYKRDVVVFIDRLATVTGHPDYPNAGDRKKAADLYEQMTAQAIALAAADPQNTRAVRDVAEAHGNLADCLLGSDPARAVNEYKAALATFSQLPQTMLSAARVIRTHALRERGLGVALERTGDHKAAMELIAAALHDFEKLAADQDVEGKQDVGNTRRVLAEVEAQSDPGAARRDFGQAISDLEIAFHAHPKDIGIRTNLSNAYRALGEFLARTGEDCSESAVWNGKAKALWQELSMQPQVSRYAHDRLSTLGAYSACTSR
jgi:tetratricopeptide (TPR) repeat protein